MSGLKSQTFDLLAGTESNSVPLLATLHGVKKSFCSNLGLESCRVITHDNQKSILSDEAGQRYPYAYLKLNSIGIIKDSLPNKSIRRNGSSIQATIGRNITIDKGYLFPARISTELVFATDSLMDAIKYIEKVAILSAFDGFSFELKMPEVSSFMVSVFGEAEDVNIPQSVRESESDPSAFEIVVPFRIETKLGIIKQVAKVNNENILTSNVETKHGNPE